MLSRNQLMRVISPPQAIEREIQRQKHKARNQKSRLGGFALPAGYAAADYPLAQRNISHSYLELF